eukprot:tig00021348_g20560.t1
MVEAVIANLDKHIADNTELAVKHGKLTEAIENLLSLEKQTRLAGELAPTSKLCVTIVSLCHQNKDWKQLNAQIVVISKRRSQIKQVITNTVQECMKFLDDTPDMETKLALIDTLRTVTAGKIFVENERARLTKVLAKIREDEGKIGEAAEILQEVQVETFGSMEKREKVDFLLEQVRLTLDHNDFIRGNIIAKKIQPKNLADKEFEDLKLRYNRLMIRYHSHSNSYLDMARCYHAIFSSVGVQADPAQWSEALKRVAVLLVLAPHDNEQSDFVNRVYEDKKLAELPAYKMLVKHFLTSELIKWPLLEELYRAELNGMDIFAGDAGKARWADFAKRVVEHNIRVISKYYSRISSARLAELLALSPSEMERNVSDMVSSKALYARIDRPAGIVRFQKPQEPSDVLNAWSGNISSLLDLVETSCHLIHKDLMTRGIEA